MTADWFLSKLPSLLDEFIPEDIFIANETDLFWKCLPAKITKTEGEDMQWWKEKQG